MLKFGLTTLQRAAASVLMCVAALAGFARTGGPFKGVWHSPDMYINIDFYGNTIPDPNSMDEDPCAGIMRVRPGESTVAYTIENVKVSGSKATATAYMAEGDSRLTFECLADGSMKVTSSNGFAYVDDSLKHLPSPQVLRKASPSAGSAEQGAGAVTPR